MASLRFKNNGTPYVDFRVHSERHRPEFLSVKDAKKFLTLAKANPVAAYQLWQESIEPQLAQGSLGKSLHDEVESFIENYCSRRQNQNDMQRTMRGLVSFVLKRHGAKDVEIRDVTHNDLGAFQTHLIASGIKNSSANRYFSTIKTFFKRAAVAQYVSVNVAQLVESLVEEKVDQEIWKEGDSTKLVDNLISDAREQVLIDIGKSMQYIPFGPIDFKRLRWDMCDFDTGMINTYRMKGRGRREWQLPIVLGFRKVLTEIRRRQELAGFGRPKDFVFATADGSPIKPGAVSTALGRARKEAGIEATPYTSRHRILTLVAKKSGRDTASMYGGHASVKTTEKHYLKGEDENFTRKVNEAFNE